MPETVDASWINKNECRRYIYLQYNNRKILQKKRPPYLFIRMAKINKINKYIDNYRLHNKSIIDIIKIPKTNNNKISINHKILKMNKNKNKESKNINYVISAYNLP